MADDNGSSAIIPEIDLEGYKITPKFEEWRRLYLDKTNRETFGNATRSAIIAYNLDPQSQYGVARTIGHENITKHNNIQVLIQEYLSENGFTLPVLLAHSLKMMTDPKVKTTHWWKEIMIMAGYKKEKAEITIENNNQINNLTNIQVDPEHVKEYKKEFAAFINARYSQPPNPVQNVSAVPE